MPVNGSGRRLKVEIYLDLLRSIHSTRKSDLPVTPYRLERLARLPYARLRAFLVELEGAGLIDHDLRITVRGYTFLQDMSSKVVPVMKRYGLWQEHD